MAKDQERDENMTKRLIQLDLLIKNFIGGNKKNVNVVGTANDLMFDSVSFESGYNEEVHYMGNQSMGSWPAFPWPPGN